MSDQNNDDQNGLRVRVRRRPAPSSTSERDYQDRDSGSRPAADEAGAPYKVGYKCPPKHSQFKPGQCGNPKGRPKGSFNWATILGMAASRRRTIGVAGKKVRMSGREAVAEQLVIAAIKGDPKARRDFLNEMRHERQLPSEADAKPDAREEPLSASDEALLADFFRRAGGHKGESS